MQGIKRHLGQNEAATMAAQAMASTPEERLSLLKATVELCKAEPAFWDSIAEAAHLSKAEIVKEVSLAQGVRTSAAQNLVECSRVC